MAWNPEEFVLDITAMPTESSTQFTTVHFLPPTVGWPLDVAALSCCACQTPVISVQTDHSFRKISKSRSGYSGITLRRRIVCRKLLSGTGWILDSSINKAQSGRLIHELVGDEIFKQLNSSGICDTNRLPRGERRCGEVEDLLAHIIRLYTGVNVTAQHVDTYIRRGKGAYHVTEAFVTLLGEKSWPPCLPSDERLRQYGCYRQQYGCFKPSNISEN